MNEEGMENKETQKAYEIARFKAFVKHKDNNSKLVIKNLISIAIIALLAMLSLGILITLGFALDWFSKEEPLLAYVVAIVVSVIFILCSLFLAKRNRDKIISRYF